MVGLYIHIPFCHHICPYCDFYKMVVSKDLKQAYIDALINELTLRINNKQVDTIYIGGGTPSSLDHHLLIKLLTHLNSLIDLNSLKEFTIELNPEDITFELLTILKTFKISRLSIGIQTFNKTYQQEINRIYNYQDIKTKVQLIKSFNFINYSFDLIYGFKGQSKKALQEDLDLILSLEPKHISIYALMIEPHSIFGYQKHITSNDDEVASLYYFMIDYLKKFNFNLYETSNFARDGFKSIHNLIYWNNESYYGVGLSAAGFINNIHYTITPKLKPYINNLSNNLLPDIEEEVLTETELKDEYIMMNLRKTSGLNILNYQKRFNSSIFNDYPNVEQLLKQQLLILEHNNLKINLKYFFVQNTIIVKLIS